MADFSAQEMAEKLLVDGLTPGTPAASELSDPIADTYVVVTLDELRPYELDPRLTKNPRYEEIKASIRERSDSAHTSSGSVNSRTVASTRIDRAARGLRSPSDHPGPSHQMATSRNTRPSNSKSGVPCLAHFSTGCA